MTSRVKLEIEEPEGKFEPHKIFIKDVFPLPQGPIVMHFTDFPCLFEGGIGLNGYL